MALILDVGLRRRADRHPEVTSESKASALWSTFLAPRSPGVVRLPKALELGFSQAAVACMSAIVTFAPRRAMQVSSDNIDQSRRAFGTSEAPAAYDWRESKEPQSRLGVAILQ